MIWKMKNRIMTFAGWAQSNWLALVIYAVLFLLFMLTAVLFSWLYGYWSNGLYETKFDLNSCWSGVTVIVTGLGGVAALAKAAWTKYNIDSQYNSAPGEPVIKKMEEENGKR